MFNVQRFGDSDILKNSCLFNVTFEYEAMIHYRWLASVIICHQLNKHSLLSYFDNLLLWTLAAFISSGSFIQPSATDVVRILLTISPTAIKHCSQIC